MLSTLIYRSRMQDGMTAQEIERLTAAARARNDALGITGILLFDGLHFIQVLEGPDAAVDELFESISQDRRHCHVVRLLRDHAPSRRFASTGMELLDLRLYPAGGGLDALLAKVTGSQAYEDRVLKILRPYAEGGWKDHFVEGADAAQWVFPQIDAAPAAPARRLRSGQPCQFALQPIVDPLSRTISSYEALLRSASGGPPDAYFSALPKEDLYEADLRSKVHAFELVNELGIRDCKLSINLFPSSLVEIPNAVDILLRQIADATLVPQQVIVEVTEQEAISSLKTFASAIAELRRAGIGVAIDDFGAGFAGLALLAEFQPDKLKIDRTIINAIHTDGARQAIVRSMLQACAAMGITPVAEGVETVEEWCWLQAAGVERFQGYLFARPALNSVPQVRWPEPAG
ncbi:MULTISPECIES: diguanylate phosphodiesterase [unclassified Achromobacter]|uniref:diguanylate phosphodiesterase n=1 Tax=unclassified Achromobacter TaxID=2626865 RepID=UPI000B51C6D2|nr:MULTISPECIES: diguanylate phosphodiesterase [unclassified Achromobacter]OWT68921.1 hypothetical protein CEY04_29490 [Achromobacter sp. HZ28]OWT78516.1 hypothetical protein CEY05_11560 [Achromobacter sp. HZ34]